MTIPIGNGHEIITVKEWGGNAARSSTALPGRAGLAVHWEGPKMGVFRPDQYAAAVRGIERFHEQTRGWTDIAYNWLFSPHGQIFEGRGEFIRSAANGTNPGNASHEAACYIGGDGDPWTPAAEHALRTLITWRRSRGLGTEVRPHSFFRPTGCPGNQQRTVCAALHNVRDLLGGTAPPPPVPTKRGVDMPRVKIGLDIPELREGVGSDADPDPHVLALQHLLIGKAGQGITADGAYGAATRMAVANVQRFFKLPDAEGVASAYTWHVLLAIPL